MNLSTKILLGGFEDICLREYNAEMFSVDKNGASLDNKKSFAEAKEINTGKVQTESTANNTPQKKVVDVRHPKRERVKDVREKNEDNGNVKTEGSSADIQRVQININQAMRGERRILDYEELAGLSSSIVMLTCYKPDGEIISSGSGIMIGKRGYILTNHHVLGNESDIFYVTIENDEKKYAVTDIIKYNPLLDLAIVRIDKQLIPINVYNGEKKLVRGQKVVAIGSPLGLFNSVSDGIIAGFRKINDVDMIQFTAPISPGSSGGAVLNLYGEVIGISTSGIIAGQNINLAVGYEYINQFIKGFVN